MKTKVYSISLGCPKNRVDTEFMLGTLPGGARVVNNASEADLVLINTCAFIQPAVEESLQTILQTAAELAELDTKPKLVVAGCLVARYGQEIIREIPEVDLWTRPAALDAWPLNAARLLDRAPSLSRQRLLSTPPSYAYLKIGEGCNHRCAYCTIPAIRGKAHSRPAEALVAEARQMLDLGVSELVLVAQDLTAYGRDQGERDGLIRLLDRLLPLDGLRWLRLLYLYPTGVTTELLRYLRAAGPQFLPYFDIPFQHVHPDILAAMGRPKSAAAERVVAAVRDAFPEAALRTSCIVGFPGESTAHFQALLHFIQSTRLHHVGVFPFYPEEGTPAATMKKQVAKKTKEARREEIMRCQAEISADILSDYVGETLPVLVDRAHDEWPGLFVGRVWFQAPEADGATYISGPGVKPGQLLEATIEEAKTYDLVALA